MNLARLSLREQRLLALGLLVLALALVARVLVIPVIDGFSARAEARATLEMQAARNARLIASVPRLGRIAIRQRTELRAFLLTAPNAEKGGEILQERLRTAVEAVGGELLEAASLEAAPDQLKARADARLSEPQLQRLLVELQDRAPYLSVDNLTVTTEDALLTGESGALSVRLDLSVPFVAAAA
ncbi:MAG: type II secretion system protein GspM [Sandaracinobacteroides sp.]